MLSSLIFKKFARNGANFAAPYPVLPLNVMIAREFRAGSRAWHREKGAICSPAGPESACETEFRGANRNLPKPP
jgi:hypothetical protein